ncbi:MAG: glycosyltransferase [Gemmatimonadales bacterium]|nr:MAG: glycosyltransferase [Gemmatimonadales bacterium]
MTLLALLGILPWVALGVLMAFFIREPRPLPLRTEVPGPGPTGDDDAVQVSIVVPARNEARNVERCLESLARMEGVAFEVILVDDRSTDDTARIARTVAPGRARELRVIDGEPLPEGWFGKPWACRQGANAARGQLLLFTDADTEHHPDLLVRSLAAMREDDAAVLSLLGRQEMGTVGERLVQPQVFTLIGLRFRSLDRVIDPERWTEAIANGQFVLVERDAYEAIGGHEAVRGEVVEDLRLAQELVRAGHRLTVRQGEDVFSTRMYTSLRELVDGWTKNVSVGARQSADRWGRWALPGIVAFLAVAWMAPALGLAAGAAAVGAGWIGPAHPLLVWAGVTWIFAVFIWMGAYARFGVSPLYALLYPLGTAVLIYILIRSGLRGTRRIEWKGRRYERGTTTP